MWFARKTDTLVSLLLFVNKILDEAKGKSPAASTWAVCPTALKCVRL